MNTKKWLVFGVSVVAAFAAFTLYQRSMSHLWDTIFPARSVRTTDTRLVDITLTDPIKKQPLHLRIPKAYLVKSENWKGGEQVVVYMETRLPEMHPAAASPQIVGKLGTSEYESSLQDFRNGVYIQLHNSFGGSPGARERYQQSLAIEGSTNGESRKPQLVDGNFYGLERYATYSCRAKSATSNDSNASPNETCTDVIEEILLSVDEVRPFVHIRCNVWDKAVLGHRLGCQAFTSYKSHALYYVFRHSEISRWMEFDDQIRRLLDGLTKNAKQD